MKSYLQYKQTVAGYQDVSETIKTLEKISTGKLHNLKKQIKEAENRAKLLSGLYRRLSFLDSKLNVPASANSSVDKKKLTVVVTGQLGLVGDMWHKLHKSVTDSFAAGEDLLVLGSKGKVMWSTERVGSISFRELSLLESTDAEINTLATDLNNFVTNGTYDIIDLMYLHSNSVTEQVPLKLTLLPVLLSDAGEAKEESVGYPIVDGSISELVSILSEKYLAGVIYQVLLETAVSEHAARTITLEHAAVKTEDLIKAEGRSFRRERRRLNTEKQLEQFAILKGV
ncbi:MAG: F0F1 ATP synthase subunit gamma [Candidatus Nomurabacteria bacterium]|nr:F0F1 ATP synthase subunit gamma [Candidatus Nomurabacteria bacterium]USN87750.1 MAG: F0F1 ATP synthase subunit gamma [Candidatus Nomurabacteria bacterium]